MNVKSDRTSQKAAKLVQSALELDGHDRNEDAYIKYLESISFIASSLLDSRQGSSLPLSAAHEPERLTKKQTQKLLSVARQCLDRIDSLTDQIEDDEVVVTGITQQPGTPSPPGMLVSRPLAYLSAACSFPVERMKPKSEKGGPSSLQLNLRGKPNSILEAINWISPEEPSLEDELNTSVKGLTSPLERASRENESLIASYRVRIERAATASARSNLQLELQRRIAENRDIARQKQETYSAGLKRRRQCHLDSAALMLRLKGDEAATKKMLHLLEETLEYEHNQRFFAQLRQKLEKLPAGPADSMVVQTVIRKTLMDPNHPLSKEVNASASHVLQRIRSHQEDLEENNNSCESNRVKDDHAEQEDMMELNVNRTCNACEVRSSSSSSSVSDELAEDAIDFEEIYSRSVDHVESALAGGKQTMKFLKNVEEKNKKRLQSKSVKKSLENLKLDVSSSSSADMDAEPPDVSVKRHFDECVHVINDVIEELIDSFVLVYGKTMDDDNARDECRIHVESHFYPPIYASLFGLCRSVCRYQEKQLQNSMQRLVDCRPLDLGYRDACSLDVAHRCEEAALVLSQLVNRNVPNEKLQLLVRVAKEICDTCSNRSEDGLPTKVKSISADDLIPLLSYACIRASKPQLVTECFLLEALTNQKNLMGEEGYCLTSLQTSLQYITSLPGLGKPASPDIMKRCLESTV